MNAITRAVSSLLGRKVRVSELFALAGESSLRPVGLAAGEFVVPDDFDDPLPDELLDAFEGR